MRSSLRPPRLITIPQRVFVLAALVSLVWSSHAFCGDIHDAAANGDLAKAKELLKADPQLVFSKDNVGNTPLHWAAQNNHKDLVELLLANKADANARNNDGWTPLLLATYWGTEKDLVKLLLDHKADVNAKDNNGATPLLFEANDGDKDVMELLLTSKADVNAKNKGGETALSVAKKANRDDLVDLLRQHGASE